MIQIIGTENCTRCKMTSKILQDRKIEFEYKLFSELENQLEIRKKAMALGMANFPIILKDGQVVKLEEVLNDTE